MAAACKYCVIVAVIVYGIVMLSLEADAQQWVMQAVIYNM